MPSRALFFECRPTIEHAWILASDTFDPLVKYARHDCHTAADTAPFVRTTRL